MIIGGVGGQGRLVQVLGHQLVSHDCSGGRWMAGGGEGEES